MPTKQSKKNQTSGIKILWKLTFGFIFFFFLIFLLAIIGLFGELPNFEEIENPKFILASEIYTNDGKMIGKYYSENRTNVTYIDLSPYLIQALIATEDERFYKHSGIDIKSTLRAICFVGQRGGASTISQQLAKQLFHAKPKTSIKRMTQKVKEWIIAMQLERQYTKDEIIAMYFNKFDFIYEAVGIKSASDIYFNKIPSVLTIQEAATLVGMVNNPLFYNPLKHYDRTLKRRNLVLSQMAKNKFITQKECDSLQALPLELHYKERQSSENQVYYFKDMLLQEVNKILNEADTHTESYITKENGEKYNIYTDGLKIYTTLNADMQKYAENAVRNHLSKLQTTFIQENKINKNAPYDKSISSDDINTIIENEIHKSLRYKILTGKICPVCGRNEKYIDIINENGIRYFVCNAIDCQHKSRIIPKDSIPIIFRTPIKMKIFTWKGIKEVVKSPLDSILYYNSLLQAGFVSMDPHTGYIKAYVGGINYTYFKYDHVIQSKRQVGSTFKPILYTTAYERGIFHPCDEITNMAYFIPQGKYGLLQKWQPEYSPKFDGLISFKFGLAQSMNNVALYLIDQTGPESVITTAKKMGIISPLEATPSIGLGVCEASLLEMVNAYCVFANNGMWIKPSMILRIEDKLGNTIWTNKSESKQVINEDVAYIILNMLKGPIDGVYNKDYGKKEGTAIRLRNEPYYFTNPIAGKTGTTQDNSDFWFIGITPDLVSGAWVGFDDRKIHLNHGSGASGALPIWALYMLSVYNNTKLNISKDDFIEPSNFDRKKIDCEDHLNMDI